MNSVGFVVLSFSVLGMAVVSAALFALRLKLSESVSHALLFGRWGLPVGGLLGFHLAFPFTLRSQSDRSRRYCLTISVAFLKAAINTSASGYQSHFTSEEVHYQVDIE